MVCVCSIDSSMPTRVIQMRIQSQSVLLARVRSSPRGLFARVVVAARDLRCRSSFGLPFLALAYSCLLFLACICACACACPRVRAWSCSFACFLFLTCCCLHALALGFIWSLLLSLTLSLSLSCSLLLSLARPSLLLFCHSSLLASLTKVAYQILTSIVQE